MASKIISLSLLTEFHLTAPVLDCTKMSSLRATPPCTVTDSLCNGALELHIFFKLLTELPCS